MCSLPAPSTAAGCVKKTVMTDQETLSVGDTPPSYMIFLLVFLFFTTGLLGFLVCHCLKKKGYRCELEEDEEDCEDKLGTEQDGKSFNPCLSPYVFKEEL